MPIIRAVARISVLTALAVVSGCRPDEPTAANAKASAAARAEHEHTAPHGGTLIELGEEFAHVELVRDRGTGTLTAYLLDGEAEHAVRVAQPAIEFRLVAASAEVVELKARESPLTGERVGDTSEFTATHEVFRGDAPVKAVLVTVAVKGNVFKDVPVVLP